MFECYKIGCFPGDVQETSISCLMAGSYSHLQQSFMPGFPDSSLKGLGTICHYILQNYYECCNMLCYSCESLEMMRHMIYLCKPSKILISAFPF